MINDEFYTQKSKSKDHLIMWFDSIGFDTSRVKLYLSKRAKENNEKFDDKTPSEWVNEYVQFKWDHLISRSNNTDWVITKEFLEQKFHFAPHGSKQIVEQIVEGKDKSVLLVISAWITKCVSEWRETTQSNSMETRKLFTN